MRGGRSAPALESLNPPTHCDQVKVRCLSPTRVSRILGSEARERGYRETLGRFMELRIGVGLRRASLASRSLVRAKLIIGNPQ